MKKEILFLIGMHLVPVISAFINPDGNQEMTELTGVNIGNVIFLELFVVGILVFLLLYFLGRRKRGKENKKNKPLK